MCASQVSFEAWLVYFGESLDASLREVVLSTLEQSVQLMNCSFAQKDRVMCLFTAIAQGQQEVDIKVSVHLFGLAFC